MSTKRQITSLIKQELQSTRRTRYVIFTFILMPIIMWGMQGVLQMLIGLTLLTSQEGEIIYVVNYDEGNGTLNLGDFLIEKLTNETNNNNSLLFGAIINHTKYSNLDYSVLINRINDSETASYYTPCIIIPENFTLDYLAYNATSFPPSVPPQIKLYTLPGGLLGSSMLEAGIYSVVYHPPFTFHVPTDEDKFVEVSSTTIVFEGEEGAAAGFGVGFVAMISIMVSVMAPAPFVSSSFAGEREKKTMESLLALPISRFNILLSKILAGMVLVGVFALMNMVGLFLFSVIINSVANGGDDGAEAYASVFAIEVTSGVMFLIVAMMFLSAFVAIGIGISLASLAKDVRSAESMYSMVMMLPAIGVGMIGMLVGVPENAFGGAGIFLYIIPWAHALAILSKGMYPQTYASGALSRGLPVELLNTMEDLIGEIGWDLPGAIVMDLVFHFGYMIVAIPIFIFIASKIFEREGILT